MDSVIQKKYFIGKSKPGTWSSVYTYKPSSQSIKDKRGEIFAAICLEGPKDYGLPTVGNMLLDKFHETYFENAQDTPLISLEKASTELGKYLQKFLENDSAGDVGIDLNFISMVIFNDLAYVVVHIRYGDKLCYALETNKSKKPYYYFIIYTPEF